MRVLGIDPGYGRLGFGIVERVNGVMRPGEAGLVETDKNTSLPARLAHIHREISQLIKRAKPDCIATEALLFAANRTTAFDVSKALGVVLLAAAEAELPWSEYTPPEVKLAVTGSGAAKKAQVQFMVAKLLSLPSPPKPDDVADALAVALCHAIRGRLAGL
ncbi:MAG: crossover junction endodeoxyribonuclease RuvC [Armatimonadota bacterium]|nr:crossover junction endodeoxyribonuclease RuvC [Armatimonadota bacterium]